MANQKDDDHFDDDDIDDKNWSQDEESFDDTLDSDFAEDDYTPAMNQKPARKKSPLLLIGGAALLLVLGGGYLAKDILMGGQISNNAAMAPAPVSTDNTSADPFAMNSQADMDMAANAPMGIPPATDTAINQDPMMNPANTMPPPVTDGTAVMPNATGGLDTYDANNINAIITDDAFAVDNGASITSADPFAQPSDMPATDTADSTANAIDPFNFGNAPADDAAPMDTMDAATIETAPPEVSEYEENAMTIPFSNETAPDATAAEVIAVEDFPISDLTADSAASNNAPTAMDTAPAGVQPQMPVETPDVNATALQETIDNLSKEVRDLESELENMRAELREKDRALAAAEANNTAASAAPTAPVAQAARPAPASAAPLNPPAPTVKPTLARTDMAMPSSVWVLRAASESQAYIARRGSETLTAVKVGDMVPGLGRISAITFVAPGGWQVMTDGGIIRQ